jgi:AcrR family transcriptional regulator
VADRRRLSPEDRRSELLALGAEVFGQRPYDEVRIDEIAERAGVSRALMYHYFPDKRAFFAAVVRAEGERLFEATNTPPQPGLSLFEQLRAGVLAYLQYDETHPHGAWANYMGMGRSDPVLRGIDDVDNDRQANRIIDRITATLAEPLDSKVERDLRVVVYGWLAFTFEMCRRGRRVRTRAARRRRAHARRPRPCVTSVCFRSLSDGLGTEVANDGDGLSVGAGTMARWPGSSPNPWPVSAS